MAMPPERISIKRRMQDDPVETLYLEHAPARDKKRRATEFLFRRLRVDEIEDTPTVPRSAVDGPRQEKQRCASQIDNSDIPQIRTTVPGDEVKDMQALKAAMKAQINARKVLGDEGENAAQRQDLSEEKAPAIIVPNRVLATARRFHLSREHNILGPSKQHAGIRKSAHRSKMHLATFVEQGLARMDQQVETMSSAAPIDRIVEKRKSISSDTVSSQSTRKREDSNEVVTKRTLNQPFVKLSANYAKTSQSIRTHPDTWDFDSEQLASELTAFAFELDPSSASEPTKVGLNTMIVDAIIEDEYIFETYIRLPHNADVQAELGQKDLAANIGVLVIAEEDEDLWGAYAESDDDKVWDEEDADSNAEDNPANDYPEDEVSSEDEMGISAYQHGRNAWDDEEYGLERDE